MDQRSERRAVGGGLPGRVQQRHGAADGLDLGGEHEHVGAQAAEVAVCQQPAGDGAGPRPLPGRVMGTGDRERALAARGRVLGRREPEGVVGELGGDRPGAALRGDAGRRFEVGRRGGVRPPAGEGEMAGALERIGDDLGEPRVHGPPFVAEVGVDHRCEQRVAEPDRAVVELEDTGGERRRELLVRDAGGGQERRRGRPERRDDCEPPAGFGREVGQAGPQQFLERGRDRDRPGRVGVRIDLPGQLEREERVPAGALVDPEQRQAPVRAPEAIAQQQVEGAGAERPDVDPVDVVEAEHRPGGCRRRRTVTAPGNEHDHAHAFHPAERERERAGRPRIEPLDVVDGDQERSAGECLERAARGDADGPRVGRVAVRPVGE